MTETRSYESIRDQARAESWGNKKIKQALYESNMVERRDELLAELGREKGPATTEWTQTVIAPEVQARLEQKAAERKAAEEAKAAAERAERERLAALRLADGDVVYCDTARNTVTRVVNSYGRQAKFDNGGYRIGVKSGELERVYFNTVCPDSFAGECFAVLKAIELAAEHGCKSITIRNDRIGGFEATTKRGYAGTKYLWVAKKISAENGLAVAFHLCTGAENEADSTSRTNR